MPKQQRKLTAKQSHWIVIFGPPIYLVTDRGSESIDSIQRVHLCTLMGIRHSPGTPHFPWTDGLFVEVQNRNLGTHTRVLTKHSPPKDWAHQIKMYAFAHNSQPL